MWTASSYSCMGVITKQCSPHARHHAPAVSWGHPCMQCAPQATSTPTSRPSASAPRPRPPFPPTTPVAALVRWPKCAIMIPESGSWWTGTGWWVAANCCWWGQSMSGRHLPDHAREQGPAAPLDPGQTLLAPLSSSRQPQLYQMHYNSSSLVAPVWPQAQHLRRLPCLALPVRQARQPTPAA